LEVIAPGAAEPHREYSQNVVCAAGAGRAVLPLALSDAAGRWRLLARDVASGVQTESTLEVR
ncbi:MAG: hypothetical protein HUU35_16810, partial [Armatimonadetes bacterium]|nr:hypothetical protein [Armatimonadota bacterium]